MKIPLVKVSYRITRNQAKLVKKLAKYWKVSESEIIRQAIEALNTK